MAQCCLCFVGKCSLVLVFQLQDNVVSAIALEGGLLLFLQDEGGLSLGSILGALGFSLSKIEIFLCLLQVLLKLCASEFGVAIVEVKLFKHSAEAYEVVALLHGVELLVGLISLLVSPGVFVNNLQVTQKFLIC